MRSLAFALGLALASPVAAAPLWQQADSGMTIAQVKAKFPAAHPPEKKDTVGGGASCELAIDSYVISGDEFRVCFFFSNNSLSQVMLSANDANEAGFEAIVELLRSKYGAELGAGKSLCKPGVMRKCEANWSLKTGTNVSTLYMSIGDLEILNIVYQTRMASEASKL